MFQLVEKGGVVKPVHSDRDLEYMRIQGWVIHTIKPAEPAKVDIPDLPVFIKRKPGRPRK